jgi:hypothetical protein
MPGEPPVAGEVDLQLSEGKGGDLYPFIAEGFCLVLGAGGVV